MALWSIPVKFLSHDLPPDTELAPLEASETTFTTKETTRFHAATQTAPDEFHPSSTSDEGSRSSETERKAGLQLELKNEPKSHRARICMTASDVGSSEADCSYCLDNSPGYH